MGSLGALLLAVGYGADYSSGDGDVILVQIYGACWLPRSSST